MTDVMTQDVANPTPISIDGASLAMVDNFRYLGSLISSN